MFGLIIMLLSTIFMHIAAASTTSTSGCGLLQQGIQQTVEIDTPWYCPINQQLYTDWTGQLPLALLAVLISFLIAGIIFMVGAATKNDRIRNFGVGELYEAIASAIIVGIFLYVAAVLFGLLPSIFVGPINPFATSFHFMLSTIQQAELLFASLYHVVMLDAYYASIKISVAFPPAGTEIGNILNLVALPLDIFFIEPAEVLGVFLAEGIIAIYAEYYLMLFFAVAAIPVFLVPGVILRAIFPTRALGSMMIAIAMAFYFVMPALFAVAFYFTAPTMYRDMASATTQISGFSNGSASILNSISPNSPLALQLSNAETAMNGLWLMMLFYPFLIIGISYAFSVQVANFMSGAGQSSGRLRAFI